MVSYCAVNDVRAVLDSDVTDAEIDVIIDIVSAMITNMVGSADSQILRGICQSWSAYRCMLKDPNARSLGEYSERREDTLKRLWEQVLFMIKHATATGGVNVVVAMDPVV